MKLNNAQASAMASQIKEQIDEKATAKHDALVKAFKKTKRFKDLERKYNQAYDNMPQPLRESMLTAYSSTSKDSIMNSALAKTLPKKERIPDRNEIEREIILASIDSNSMEELMRKLPSKFKVKS